MVGRCATHRSYPLATTRLARPRMTGDLLLALGAALASGVEVVEAMTIVLALGTARGWRSPLLGAGAALVVLAVAVAAVGPALTRLPIDALRLVVGTLVLLFGLQWLRKAILRAGGRIPLHDEDLILAAELEHAREATRSAGALDAYSFVLALKSTLLEGVEVVFIVLTLGASRGSVTLAAVGAAVAAGVVIAVGVAIRQPLSRLPENALKFAVGVMLTAFGSFWAAEGAGVDWPGQTWPLIGLVLVTLALVAGVRRLVRPTPRTRERTRVRRAASAVLAFVVGDDVRVALGVAAMLGAVAGAVHAGLDPWWIVPVAVPLVLGWSLRRATRQDASHGPQSSV